MKISQAGKELIISFESIRLEAYQDSVGIWTIGIGSTSPPVKEGDRLTRQQVFERFENDLKRFEAGVARLVKVDLEQHQFDALVSFAFNCGLGNLEKSTLLKRVNSRDFDKVPAEFMKWTRANGREMKGLVRRRRAETAMWRNVDESDPAIPYEEARAKPDKPTPKKSMSSSIEGNASILIGAGAIGTAVKEAKPVIQDAADAYTAATAAIGTPAVLVALLLLGLAGLIWWRRRQRMIEEES